MLALILGLAHGQQCVGGGQGRRTVPFRVALQTFPVETGFDPDTGILVV